MWWVGAILVQNLSCERFFSNLNFFFWFSVFCFNLSLSHFLPFQVILDLKIFLIFLRLSRSVHIFHRVILVYDNMHFCMSKPFDFVLFEHLWFWPWLLVFHLVCSIFFFLLSLSLSFESFVKSLRKHGNWLEHRFWFLLSFILVWSFFVSLHLNVNWDRMCAFGHSLDFRSSLQFFYCSES
jgi:hypothetical protein